MRNAADLRLLNDRIRRLERPGATRHGVVPFGVAALDRALPGGGLALGALHEILGAGADEEDAAIPAGFAAGIVGRLGAGTVLWCLGRGDLYGPGLAARGLDPGRLVLVRTARDDDILWAMEEGLHAPGNVPGGIAAVIGEVGRLPMVASRRLQLAAEQAGLAAFVLRRWHTGAEAAAERTRPSAAVTRWRIAALPSAPVAGEPGIGRPRWRVELLRCRGGMPAAWDVPADVVAGLAPEGTAELPGKGPGNWPGDWSAADATDPLSLAAELADRPAAPRRPAAGREGRRCAG